MEGPPPPAETVPRYLVESGIITAEMAAAAARRQASSGERFAAALVGVGSMAGDDLLRGLLRRNGEGAIEVDGHPLQPRLLELLPERLAFDAKILPVHLAGKVLFAAVPAGWTPATELPGLDQALGLHLEPFPVEEADVPGLLIKGLQMLRRRSRPTATLPAPPPGRSRTPVDEGIAGALDSLFALAATWSATEIHLGPKEGRIELALRIDGRLRQQASSPVTSENVVRALAQLKREAAAPEGVLERNGVEVRLSVRPSSEGEHAILRLIDRTGPVPGLDRLGMPDDLLKRYLEAIANPQGLILFTGTGTTTSLAATLEILRKRGLKIATSLGGILRQEPDVILAGDLGDRETAQLAVRAAVTGHLVFSTVAAPDSVGVVRRLAELGVDPALISLSLVAALHQRLLRRVCAGCSREHREDVEALEDLGLKELLEGVPLRKGAGCDSCGNDGHRGRVAAFEFWEPDGETREQIAKDPDDRKIRSLAYSKGLKPLVVDALAKLRAGVTSFSELRDVVPYNQIVQAGAFARRPSSIP